MPPTRSPFANEARIASAARAQARLGSRLADVAAGDDVQAALAGRDREQDRVVGQPLEQCLGVAAGRRAELADVDREVRRRPPCSTA